MGLKIKTQRSLPIGVDLGSSSLKVVQLRTSGSNVELLAALSAELPRDCRGDLQRQLNFQADSIQAIVRSAGFTGREAVLSLPASVTFLQSVRVPVLPSKEADHAVKTELLGKLPYPVEDAVIRHILAGTVYDVDGHDMHERIVVAVARANLDAYLAMARRAGLDVVGADIEACAVVECFARTLRRATEESRGTLFMDIGSSSTQLVLAHGQTVAFARNLPVGGQAMDQAVADALKVPLEQAHHMRMKMLQEEESPAANELYALLNTKIAEITDEISQCLRYTESAFRNRSVDRLVFVGGQAHNKRLCQSIAQRLNLPAQVGDPMVGIKPAQGVRQAIGFDLRQPQPAWAVAIGLSLGAEMAA